GGRAGLGNGRGRQRAVGVRDIPLWGSSMTDDWSRHDRGPDGDRRLADVADGLQMPLEHAVLTQRAVRKVLPDPVDDAIVLRCIELALHAPTGSNGQNWEFVVVKDLAAQERLAVPSAQARTVRG